MPRLVSRAKLVGQFAAPVLGIWDQSPVRKIHDPVHASIDTITFPITVILTDNSRLGKERRKKQTGRNQMAHEWHSIGRNQRERAGSETGAPAVGTWFAALALFLSLPTSGGAENWPQYPATS